PPRLSPSLSLHHSPLHHRPHHSFPTRRSSDLSPPVNRGRRPPNMLSHRVQVLPPLRILIHAHPLRTCLKPISSNRLRDNQLMPRDRKSTRLNSSHVSISYAVFCLKKKRKPKRQ